MARIGFTPDPDADEWRGDFAPIPAGEYRALIEATEMKPNNRTDKNPQGQGEHLSLTFQLLDEPYKGRKIWTTLNLDHPSQQAVEIARAELTAICRACGKDRGVQDSDELKNIPMTVKLKLEPDHKKPGEYRNRIIAYTAIGGAAPKPAAATAAKPSWKK